jgi:hypothetical protein
MMVKYWKQYNMKDINKIVDGLMKRGYDAILNENTLRTTNGFHKI